VIETVAFQENPTRITPTNNTEIPNEGMFRNGIPIDSKTKTNPMPLRL